MLTLDCENTARSGTSRAPVQPSPCAAAPQLHLLDTECAVAFEIWNMRPQTNCGNCVHAGCITRVTTNAVPYVRDECPLAVSTVLASPRAINVGRIRTLIAPTCVSVGSCLARGTIGILWGRALTARCFGKRANRDRNNASGVLSNRHMPFGIINVQ